MTFLLGSKLKLRSREKPNKDTVDMATIAGDRFHDGLEIL